MSNTAIVNTPYGGNYSFHFRVNETSLIIDNQFQVVKFNNQFINIVASGAGSTYFRIGPSGNQYILNYQNCTNPVGSSYSTVSDFITALQNAINGTVTINGTTAGTATLRLVEVSGAYKKYIIFLNGYENTTSTEQTINFPIPFNTFYSVVYAETNTGTTITVAVTPTYIKLPVSMTATESGSIILEGY